MAVDAVTPTAVREQVDLAPLTTLELGGPARYLAVAEDLRTAIEVLRWARRRELPVTVLGGGSNVVVADAGVGGVVLRVALRGLELHPEGDTVTLTAAAGEPWDEVVARAVEAGLAGLECLSGIPGTAGATPIQNVGAYGQEVADTLAWVEVLDRETLAVRRMPAAACDFAYRTSRFRRQPHGHLILSVSFRLRAGGAATVRYPELAAALGGAPGPPLAEVRRAVVELRRAKSMVVEERDPNRRSVGSFFLNPVLSPSEAAAAERRAARAGLGTAPSFPTPEGGMKLSAAWLIERCGYERGLRRGSVGISSRHSLALVHHGGGRSAELVALAAEIRSAVRDAFGIDLEPEPRFLGFADADPTA